MQSGKNDVPLAKSKQTSLNFGNIRQIVREVILRMLNASSSQHPSSEGRSISEEELLSSSTISNQDKALIEQLFTSSKLQNNLHRLQLKKEQLTKELEKNQHELLEKGTRNFNIVELHRKHCSNGVVFSGNQIPMIVNRGAIEMHTTSADSTLFANNQHDLHQHNVSRTVETIIGGSKHVVFSVVLGILRFLLRLVLHSR
ncbi:hypothetical protein C9374_014451 [Naegleria lovaniensis]|uniref:Uncharacterized protein n=1 Tax=Naegleria lovaniensis TaxID=51637 RepID=A0AA88KPW5_NAELO|nr:uncharacterized protein C9374_014451 [Naegleria lovaniensis]KAG2389051.1 hypothetical protein C9374_014451 [Naegleria lovaniensis]